MALPQLYPGMINSSPSFLADAIDAAQTSIDVLDASKLPPAENLLTIGTGEDAETMRVTAVSGNTLTVERAFQGVARAWDAGTIIARYFTEYDFHAIMQWLQELKNSAPVLNADVLVPAAGFVQVGDVYETTLIDARAQPGVLIQLSPLSQSDMENAGGVPTGSNHEDGTYTLQLMEPPNDDFHISVLFMKVKVEE